MGANCDPVVLFHACKHSPNLYIRTVFAIVYRCRQGGRLLDRSAIQSDPVRGELRVQRRGMKRIAQLLGADGERYVLPVLDKVRLLAMNERGVLLSGYEMLPPRGEKGMGTAFPQTWWCVLRGPVGRDSDPAQARARAQAMQAQQLGASMVGHSARRGAYAPVGPASVRGAKASEGPVE